jgi:hypothetical protein
MKSIEIPQPEDRDWRYRFFEILPGTLSWTVLLLPVILGAFVPWLALYFILAYLVLWFIRAIGMNIRSLQGYKTMDEHRNLPWEKLNQELESLEVHTYKPGWHARNVERVKTYILAEQRILPSQVYHALIIAFYNESYDVLEPTIQSVLASQYDMKKVILFIAYEERGGEGTEATAQKLMKEFGDKFYHAEAVKHPDGISGEVRGKGGNITYAGRQLQKYLEKEGIDPLHVLVTTLDSDNRPDKRYLGALTYTYCSTEDPKHSSYQPIPMFLNNIWDAPAPMRVIATGNSFWNIILSLRPHMLRNFSSHAQPMAALIDTDFWSVRTIVEDGHQYWRSYFRFDGNHEVYPIFVPIYQDAVLTDSYKKTLKAQFIQVRRWAYGASDIAYVAYTGYMKKNNIPWHKKTAKFLRLVEGHLSWATSPLILILAAYPVFIFHGSSQLPFVGYSAQELPQIASKMQTVAMAGILISLFLSFRSLPPKPERYKRHRTLWMIVQWVYLPVTTIIYSSFAAINSQTRLMFKLYLGSFDVTEKAVRKDAPQEVKT